MGKIQARECQNIEYKSSWQDAWGRSYKKIREGFEGAGLPMPKIENVDGGVKVTFMRKNANGGNVVVNAIDGLTERQLIMHTAIKQNVVDGVVVTASSLSKQLKVH